jgi:coenzyme PQQ precursor peptide PqqA
LTGRWYDGRIVAGLAVRPGRGKHITVGSDVIMEWTKPAFEEICLNCEINSYASAQL